MSQVHRRAPDLEWVEMYRRGMTTTSIAKIMGAGASTVRYHLRLAVQTDPTLRDQHTSAARNPARVTVDGLANMADLVALHEYEGRLPSTKSKHARERALAVWLLRRRQDFDAGKLAPEYREGLETVPEWEQRTRKTKDAAQWEARLHGLVSYWAEGNDWPRHKGPDSEEERLLGVWLQYQRTKLAAGQLSSDKEARLDEALPGWRQGRTKGRIKRSSILSALP
jgi:hypothetical protein